MYNFLSFSHIYSRKHHHNQDNIPIHHASKVLHPSFLFLIIPGKHGPFSRNLYKSNHTLCTCFSLVSYNRHNYFELHSWLCILMIIHSILLLSGLPLCRYTTFIYPLTCSSFCGYYCTYLYVNICFHFFWVKTQREELDCVGVFKKKPNCFPKASHYFIFPLAV